MKKLSLKKIIKKDTESKDTIPTVNSYCMSFSLVSQAGGIIYMRMNVWKMLSNNQKKQLLEKLIIKYNMVNKTR